MATVSLSPPTALPESTALNATEDSFRLPEGMPYRLTAQEFFQMVEADILPPKRRIALWEGQLYEKMAKKMPHAVGSSKVNMTLLRSLPEGWSLWPENPILIDDFTAPLPDVSIIRGTPDDFIRKSSVPKTEDIGLVVEIAEASLQKNLTTTLQIYARAGLPVYWVVNLVARRVEVYSEPRVAEDGVAGYSSVAMFDTDHDVPLVLGGREVARIPARALIPVEVSGP